MAAHSSLLEAPAPARRAPPDTVPRPPQAQPPAGPRAAPPLALLPREVLLRALAFLAAADLTSAASACRALRELTGEEVLWRRLYCARWGRQRSNSSTRRWKVGCGTAGACAGP
jgi:hypothetical protein